jgi:hypothetical protein
VGDRKLTGHGGDAERDDVAPGTRVVGEERQGVGEAARCEQGAGRQKRGRKVSVQQLVQRGDAVAREQQVLAGGREGVAQQVGGEECTANTGAGEGAMDRARAGRARAVTPDQSKPPL